MGLNPLVVGLDPLVWRKHLEVVGLSPRVVGVNLEGLGLDLSVVVVISWVVGIIP